jgi:ComF family protein
LVDQPAGCPTCQKRKLKFSELMFLGMYEESLRSAILRMKHAREEPLTTAMAELLWSERHARLLALEADVLAPIAMHWSRRTVRGTNSPEILAESLARRLRTPAAMRLLRRRKRTLPQGGLPQTRRFENLRDAFVVRGGSDVRGCHVLLVDDVLTTGATCNAASAALLKAGAAKVSVVALARAASL